MRIHVTHAALVTAATEGVKRALEHGTPAIFSQHDRGPSCQGARCLEVHMLGSGHPTGYRPDAPLEGAQFSIYGMWDVHATRYVGISAYFPGLFEAGETIDLTADVLGTVRA